MLVPVTRRTFISTGPVAVSILMGDDCAEGVGEGAGEVGTVGGGIPTTAPAALITAGISAKGVSWQTCKENK